MNIKKINSQIDKNSNNNNKDQEEETIFKIL